MASFLMKGKRAVKAWKQAEKTHKKQEDERKNRVYRFYLPTGAEQKITFIDGDLTPDGIIDVSMFREHNLKLNGHWKNWFRCTDFGGEGAEPCPICEGGDNAYVASVFSIIDHSLWTDSKGKKHQHEMKLFVAKREALNILQKHAVKRGGLAGVTFEVSRAGDNSPNVGNVFEFVKKNPVAKIIKAFGAKGFPVGMVDYEKALPYYTAAELRDKGFGSSSPVGEEDGAPFDSDDDDTTDLDELI